LWIYTSDYVYIFTTVVADNQTNTVIYKVTVQQENEKEIVSAAIISQQQYTFRQAWVIITSIR